MFKIKLVLSLIGAAILLVALLCYQSTDLFLQEAIRTEGRVVGFKEQRGDDSVTYRPVVVFLDTQENPIRFVSRVGSGRPAYSKGERVNVLYLSAEPEAAKLESFFDLWGATVVFAVIGLPFFLIGTLMFVFGWLKKRKSISLKQTGIAVLANFQSVEPNYCVSINGRNPYKIVCQWLSPETQELHLFESDNLWFDPSDYIKTQTLTVFIKPGDPKKYHMDVSFLPRVAR